MSNNTFTVEGSPSSSVLQKSLSDLGNNRKNGINIDEYVLSSDDAILNAFLASQVFNASPSKLSVYKKLNEQLVAQYPGSDYATEFASTMKSMEATLY